MYLSFHLTVHYGKYNLINLYLINIILISILFMLHYTLHFRIGMVIFIKVLVKA